MMAYKLKDVEMLEAAQKSVEVNFLEREVQLLGKHCFCAFLVLK